MSNTVGGWANNSRFVNLLSTGGSIMGPNLSDTSSAMGGTHGYNAFASVSYCLGGGSLNGTDCPNGWAVDLGNMKAGTSDFGLKKTGAWPIPQMQLDTGSPMIGAGTNDPLGQGAGICGIDPVAEWGCGDDNSNGNCDPGEICQDAEACQLIDCLPFNFVFTLSDQ